MTNGSMTKPRTTDPQLAAICREACLDLLRAFSAAAFAHDDESRTAARRAFTMAKAQICLSGSPALVVALADYATAVEHSAQDVALVPLVMAMRREAFHPGETDDLADEVMRSLVSPNLRQ